jgi:transcriptional regulator GlxA family with amidase domain
VGAGGSAYASDSEAVSRLLAAATATLDTDRDAAKACIQRVAELLRRILGDSSRQVQNSSAARGGLALWQQQRVAAYVAANLGSCIRAADLAHVAGLSTGHFFRAFRDSFGEPPLAYVTRQRVRHCQELMLNSQASLCEIALDCGMCDQAHLTRVFRRIVGVNPGLWRRQFAQHAASDEKRDASKRATPVQYESTRRAHYPLQESTVKHERR